MKLILCPYCGDIFSLSLDEKSCYCGSSKGKYLDKTRAAVSKDAIPLGINNASLINALAWRPDTGEGSEFTAFVIPEKCESVIVESNTIEG